MPHLLKAGTDPEAALALCGIPVELDHAARTGCRSLVSTASGGAPSLTVGSFLLSFLCLFAPLCSLRE